jgi:tyrosyl-tRNA synthetase
MAKLSEVLRERGYVYQFSAETLEEITDGEKRTLYWGVDPSADSMHVGNLVGLLVLRRFLEDGHKIILLTGGGTGMIGDPGGKSAERNLLDAETVKRNTKAVADQIKKVFGSSDFIEVDNAQWLSQVKLLEFLRDIGKYFSVNSMIKKDMVRDRLNAESSISFTEFSYSLLQGYDFLYLNKTYACDMQVGGSDQWSNILAGVEFIRRKEDKTVYALTWPLLINKATGKKFGKSESGAVWLDPKKTSPFKFYQFWLNTEDDAVEEYLLKMTMLSKEEIDTVMNSHKQNPAERRGQRILATAVTMLVHGADNAAEAETASQALFGADSLAGLDDDTVAMLKNEAPGCAADAGNDILDLLVASGLASSKREARQFIEGGAITINGEKLIENRLLVDEDFIKGAVLMRRGKRSVALLTLQK